MPTQSYALIVDILNGESIDSSYVLIYEFVRFDGVNDQLSVFDIIKTQYR